MTYQGKNTGKIFQLIYQTIQINTTHSTPTEQNGCHFTDNILKFIFINKNVYVDPNFTDVYSRGPINNKSALGQMMACRLTRNTAD